LQSCRRYRRFRPKLCWNDWCSSQAEMNEIAEAFRQRARRFAVRLVKFLRLLSRDPVTAEIVRQLARSGPAVSAN
jgi:hypothetical protein